MTRPGTAPRVVVTRPVQPRDDLIERLQTRGCEVVAAPAIALGPPRSYQGLDRVVRGPQRFAWVLFMSRTAVRYYVRRARRLRRGAAPIPAEVCVGVVGPSTAAAAARAGLTIDVQSPGRTGADLAEAVIARLGPRARGTRAALIQAEDGRPEAARRLRAAGLEAVSAAAYRTRPAPVPPPIVQAVRAGAVDALVFASPSSAISFAVALGGLGSAPPAVAIAAIGPTTAAACARAGRAPDVMPPAATAAALAEAVAAYLDARAPLPSAAASSDTMPQRTEEP